MSLIVVQFPFPSQHRCLALQPIHAIISYLSSWVSYYIVRHVNFSKRTRALFENIIVDLFKLLNGVE